MGSKQRPVHTKYLHWLSLHFVHRQEMLAIFVDIPLLCWSLWNIEHFSAVYQIAFE